MNTQILQFAGTAIYTALGLAALYGLFCVILLIRRINKKRFTSMKSATAFQEDIHEKLMQKDFEGIVETCDSPKYWNKAIAQLMLVSLDNIQLGPMKLRRLIGEKFERDVLSDLEYRTSWVSTIVKSAPMLGLLGTVTGMINAFAKIATMQKTGGDPSALAGDISLALSTTAIGLLIAIPLVLAVNMIHVRISKLQDSVQDQIGKFIDDLQKVLSSDGENS